MTDLVRRLRKSTLYLSDGDPTSMGEEAANYIDALTAENKRLREALKEVAQTLAWQSFGECRGFSDNLLSPLEAYNLAKAELAALNTRKGQP